MCLDGAISGVCWPWLEDFISLYNDENPLFTFERGGKTKETFSGYEQKCKKDMDTKKKKGMDSNIRELMLNWVPT